MSVVNSFIPYNLLAHQAGLHAITENDFRDMLVQQIIETYSCEKREPVTRGRPPRSTYCVHHGSNLTKEKGCCQFCKLNKKVNFTQRKCSDCPFTPLFAKQWREIAMLLGITPPLTKFDLYGLINKSTNCHILLMLEPLEFPKWTY